MIITMVIKLKRHNLVIQTLVVIKALVLNKFNSTGLKVFTMRPRYLDVSYNV